MSPEPLVRRPLSGPSSWVVEQIAGPAAALHALALPEDPRPTAWFLDADGPALVLGSTQSIDDVDLGAAVDGSVDVVRRRSGGGAVLVGAADSTWLDLVIPRTSSLWHDDVGRAMHWVGEVWAAALTDLGVEVDVHRGPLRPSAWSRQVCFAGLGAGEVVDRAGRKVVGVSQRRVRGAARFQTIAYHEVAWSPTSQLLDRRRVGPGLLDELSRQAATVAVDPAALRTRLIAHLPDPA